MEVIVAGTVSCHENCQFSCIYPLQCEPDTVVGTKNIHTVLCLND